MNDIVNWLAFCLVVIIPYELIKWCIKKFIKLGKEG